MYLYNVTFMADENTLSWWDNWMRTQYLPAVEAASDNVKYTVFKIVEPICAPDTHSFSCQWTSHSLADLEKTRLVSERQLAKLQPQVGEGCVFVSSFMKKTEL